MPDSALDLNKDSVQSILSESTLDIFHNAVGKWAHDPSLVALKTLDAELRITEYTYAQLSNIVIRFCSILASKLAHRKYSHDHDGAQHKAVIIASASLDSTVAMLSCASLGIEHCVLFEELSADAIAERVNRLKPDLIIYRSKSDKVLLKIEGALENLRSTAFAAHISIIEIDANTYNLPIAGGQCVPLNISSISDRLFTLFTSGSTSLPKGVEHKTIPYIIYSLYTTKKYFDLSRGDSIFTGTDAAWINGHTYAVYGPLLCGATTIFVDPLTSILDPEYLVEFLSMVKVDVLYSSVTSFRALRAISGDDLALPSRCRPRIVGCCGEMLSPSLSSWIRANIQSNRNAPVINTYFQTETGGIIQAPLPSDKDYIDGSVGKVTPSSIIDIPLGKDEYYDSTPFEIESSKYWPGMFDSLLQDFDGTLRKGYFNVGNKFQLFDQGYLVDEQLFVIGRSDDVINVSGHRIGSAEVEDVLSSMPEIREGCIIGVSDSISGEVLVAVISLSLDIPVSGQESLKEEIKNKIRNLLTPYHVPSRIYIL